MAVPFGDPLVDQLSSRFSVRGIPALKVRHFSPFFTSFTLLLASQVVGRDGSEISANARDEVMAVGKEAFVQVGRCLIFFRRRQILTFTTF